LSAPFVIDFFFDALNSVLPYADVVFCNETEALTLGKKLNWGEDLLEIAQKLRNYEKVNKNKKRTVIFTQGAKATILVRQDQVRLWQKLPRLGRNFHSYSL
jgi:adenosine kinase